VSKLCRVWEPSQVQATKRSDVAYIIRILSLESCICVVVVYMILVIMRKIAWFLFIIELHDSLIRLAYPCFLCSCLVLYVSFCDDHLFDGSKYDYSVKGISGGWRVIVLVLKRRFSVETLAVVGSIEFISLVIPFVRLY